MKKFNKYLLATFLTGSLSAPIFASISCGKKSLPFEQVHFDNQVFNSKNELLNYINKNIDKLENAGNDNKVFSINEGGDQKTFSSYQDAIDYIGNKIVTKTVYLNSNALKSGGKISPSDFVEKAQTQQFYVFEKWTKVNKDEHEYSYVSTSASKEEINKAKLEAAETYIQVHNGYCFNGIYFANATELTQYLQLEIGKITAPGGITLPALQNQISGTNNQIKRLFLENGTSFDFNFNKNDDLSKSDLFKEWVNLNAKPYFVHKNADGTTSRYPINSENEASIALNIDQGQLNAIGVESNNGKVTQIVDMDRSTPNGRIYGGYFVESAESIDGIRNIHNWNRTESNDLQSVVDSNDVQIVKSFIDYILTAQGISSPIQLMDRIKIDENNETFFEFLRNERSKDNASYLDKAKDLFSNLSQGSRYSTLDTIIALHSYLINKMIQDGKSNDEIYTLSKYFRSMTRVLDSYTSLFLAPFFGMNNATQDQISNFKINYFENAFHFYDDSNKYNYHGITFQSSPYSYYRTLIGHIGDDNGKEQIAYFKMIKAMMGLQAISMKALNVNQTNLENWIKGGPISVTQNNLYGQYNQEIAKNLEFIKDGQKAKDEGKIWDFQFSGKYSSPDTEEFKSIWSNLSDLDCILNVNGKTYNSQALENNFNDYITKYQNAKISSYTNNINDFSRQIFTLVTGKEYNDSQRGVRFNNDTQQIWFNSQDLRNDLSNCVDTFSMIDIDKSNLNSNISSSLNEFNAFDDMQKHLVQSIDQRIAGFVSNVGSTVASIGCAMAAAAEVSRMTHNQGKTVTRVEETSVTLIHDSSINGQSRLAIIHGQNSITESFDYGKVTSQNNRARISRLHAKYRDIKNFSALSDAQLKRMSNIFANTAPELDLSIHTYLRDRFQNIEAAEERQTNLGEYHTKYDEYLKTAQAPVQSFDDFCKAIDEDAKNAPAKQVSQTEEMDSGIEKLNLLSAHTNNGIASVLGILSGSATFEAIASFALNIATAFVPELAIINGLINFIASFSGSEQQVYAYHQHEAGTDFYWDGGEVDYSWWGLSQTVKYDIHDLKLITSQEDIISAYETTGLYYNGKFLADTAQLRADAARQLISTFSKLKVNDDAAKLNSNVEWVLELQGKNNVTWNPSQNSSQNSIDDFYSDIVSYAKEFSKNIYVMKGGVLTSSAEEAKKDFINQIVESLSECTFIVLPSKQTDGTLLRATEFSLPRPYWTMKDGLVQWKQGEELNAANYIVKNPNVNTDSITTSQYSASEIDAIKELINGEAKGANPSPDTIMNLVDEYAKYLYVPTRTNIFEDLRDPQNMSYEDLDKTSWLSDVSNIYSFSKLDLLTDNQVNLDAYYLHRSDAMKDALQTKYSITAVAENSLGVAYRFRFNNQIFHSIDQIYQWIIAHQTTKGEQHE